MVCKQLANHNYSVASMFANVNMPLSTITLACWLRKQSRQNDYILLHIVVGC